VNLSILLKKKKKNLHFQMNVIPFKVITWGGQTENVRGIPFLVLPALSTEHS
jgi:hypothetical protein